MAGPACAQEPCPESRQFSCEQGGRELSRLGTCCLRSGSRAIPPCWSALGVVLTSSLSHVVSCTSARATLIGRLMCASGVSTRGGIPLVRRSSIRDHGLSASPTPRSVRDPTWHALLTLLVRVMVLASVAVFLQVSVAQFPVKFLLRWIAVRPSAHTLKRVQQVCTVSLFVFYSV